MDLGRQIGAATLIGAAVGAVLSGAVAAVQHLGPVRAGEVSMADAAYAVAGSAMVGGVRSGAVAGLGAWNQFAATRGGVAASVVGKVPVGAVASVVVGVAESALAFARGGIGVSDFALRACESTFVSGASWAGGAFGQAVIPFPVVGALVGGLAAQWCATVATDAIRSALGVASGEDFDPERTQEPLADPTAVETQRPRRSSSGRTRRAIRPAGSTISRPPQSLGRSATPTSSRPGSLMPTRCCSSTSTCRPGPRRSEQSARTSRRRHRGGPRVKSPGRG